MIHNRIFLICFPGDEAPAQQLAESVINAWPSDNPPAIELHHPDNLPAPKPAAAPDIAWVYLGEHHLDDQLFELFETLATQHQPTLITRTHETLNTGSVFQAGSVVVPQTAPPEHFCLVIQTLASQVDSISHLRQELSITRRHHGGLLGQIDKLDEELRLAARVQREFLPTEVPQLEDTSVEVFFRPASYVSGDIYDCQRLDEHHIALWIADVVGHGVPAALLTMFVKHALPTKDIIENQYRIVPPNEALSRLNIEMTHRPGGGNRFATAVYALINTQTNTLQIARAGHPFPILLRADGSAVNLEPDGALLGIFAEEQFELTTIQLEPGDRLVLYSDGFETAFGNDDDSYDTTRYREEFLKLTQGTPSQALASLEQIVDAQPGSLHQADDLTILMATVGQTPDAKAQQQHMENTIRKRTIPAA